MASLSNPVKRLKDVGIKTNRDESHPCLFLSIDPLGGRIDITEPQ
jgi:hypothetical protein